MRPSRSIHPIRNAKMSTPKIICSSAPSASSAFNSPSVATDKSAGHRQHTGSTRSNQPIHPALSASLRLSGKKHPGHNTNKNTAKTHKTRTQFRPTFQYSSNKTTLSTRILSVCPPQEKYRQNPDSSDTPPKQPSIRHGIQSSRTRSKISSRKDERAKTRKDLICSLAPSGEMVRVRGRSWFDLPSPFTQPSPVEAAAEGKLICKCRGDNFNNANCDVQPVWRNWNATCRNRFRARFRDLLHASLAGGCSAAI
jgi:hypothetical protein